MERNQNAIVNRITEQMEKRNLDAILLTSGDAIFYATGFGVRKLYRAEPSGAAAAVVTKEGNVGLVISEFDRHAAESIVKGIQILSYPTWIFIADYTKPGEKKEPHPSPLKAYELALEFIPRRKNNFKLGVQSSSITHQAWVYLAEQFGENNLVDAQDVLREARVIKTPWEIETLRTAAHLDEIVMNKTAKAIVPGMTSADVAQLFNKFAFESSPDIISVSNAHTIGSDFTPYVTWPHHRINYGDVIRLDGGGKYKGYNSDLARTFVVGKDTAKERENLYSKLWAGYEFAISHIGPGVRFSDIFNGIHEVLNKLDFGLYIRGHQGHSIGCGFDGEEAPFIGPKENRVFEPGMVLNIEMPYYSSKNQTYNIEDTFLITENGIELFTKASPSLYL